MNLRSNNRNFGPISLNFSTDIPFCNRLDEFVAQKNKLIFSFGIDFSQHFGFGLRDYSRIKFRFPPFTTYVIVNLLKYSSPIRFWFCIIVYKYIMWPSRRPKADCTLKSNLLVPTISGDLVKYFARTKLIRRSWFIPWTYKLKAIRNIPLWYSINAI